MDRGSKETETEFVLSGPDLEPGELPSPGERNLRTEFLDGSEEGIAKAAEMIRRGGLVAFPTETVYGLGASALDPEAAKKIYRAKGRPSDNPLIVHLADPSEAEKYADTTPLYYELAEKFMPGPLTVILPARDTVPRTVTGGLDSVGIRVPVDQRAHLLIRLAGVPIAAPSANISGRPSPTNALHCMNDLDGRVDAVIDGGECAFGLESTIVKPSDCPSEGNLRRLTLLRPGAVTPEDLKSVCEDLVIDPCITAMKKFEGKALAPGMKYRHYAPEAPVTIVDGEDESVTEYILKRAQEQEEGGGCGVLCFDGDERLLKLPNALSYGKKDDPRAQAHRLFDCLRSYRGVGRIYARMPSREGMGLAVFNRLVKAAGYEIVTL